MDDIEDDYELEIDEEEMFERLLRSMNVPSWDASVPIALADYARSKSAISLADRVRKSIRLSLQYHVS
jgi:hypothetical protein